jgi:hypothetical protein
VQLAQQPEPADVEHVAELIDNPKKCVMDMKVRSADDQCMTPQALTLRVARPDDDPALRRLAQLDSSRPPTGPVLLAVVGSEPVAALSVETGAVVADPFRPTAGVVAVLRQAAA